MNVTVRSFLPRLSLFCILFCGLITASVATSFYIRPFSETIQEATWIVRGTIESVRAEKIANPDGSSGIFTYATLRVTETLKGRINQDVIRIRKIGGTRDGVTLEIPSSVTFIEGEDNVFFLSNQNLDESYEVAGMELGRYKVTTMNGKESLQGGIFAYANSEYAENQKVWTLDELKSAVASRPENTGPTNQIADPMSENRILVNANTPSDPMSKNNQVTSESMSPEPETTTDSGATSSSKTGPAFIVALILLGVGLWFRKRLG